MLRKVVLIGGWLWLAGVSLAMQVSELLPEERNTVTLFQTYSPNVVHVHRLTRYVNYDHETLDVPAGSGSGIIWDQAGHVVTNFHVVAGADRLAVSVGNMTVPAKVIGVEPRRDLAVLKVDLRKVAAFFKQRKPFALAATNELLVGQKVLAIGNPFGLDHSLSVGVISAIDRHVPGAGGVTIRHMIQTDAAINPGNSGGPLLDSQGKLIGLNTVIFSSSGSSAGVGFAVPADEIGRIVPQLIQSGRVRLSGIGIARIPASVAAKLGVKTGVLVGDVMPHTPAAKVRLQGTYRSHWGQVHLGDVIVKLNAQKIQNYDELYNALAEIPVGTPITITILRGQQTRTFSMKTIDISAGF